MAGTLDGVRSLPPWGKAAIAAGGLGVVWLMYRQRSANAANAASSASTGTDPVTGLPYSQDSQTDPQTGLTYLSEAEQYGSVSGAEAAVSGGSGFGTFPVTGGTAPVLGTTSGYGTNAQWAQAAQAGLESVGYSPTDVAQALGQYLGSLPLTSSEAGIVHAAIAEYGDPPVGTFPILLQPPAPAGAPSAVVPHVTGMQVNDGIKALDDAGLKPGIHQARNPADTYVITSQTPGAGQKVPRGSTVDLAIAPHTFTK